MPRKAKELPEGLYLRGKTYWMRYTDQHGKRHFESAETKLLATASTVLAKRRAEIHEGTFFPRRAGNNPTWAQLSERYFAHDKVTRKKSLADDKQRFPRIVAFFGADKAVLALSVEEVRAFRTHLGALPGKGARAFVEGMDRAEFAKVDSRGRKTTDRLHPITINRHIALLKTAIKRLVGINPNWNPFDSIELFSEKRFERTGKVTQIQFQKLLQAAKEKDDLTIHAMIQIGYFTGMRLESVLNLKTNMIDKESKALELPVGYLKNSAPLTVPLTDEILASLEALPKREDGRVFDDIAVASASNRFSRLAKSIGLACTFHDFRRTAATNLRKAKVPTNIVLGIVGWKSPQMFTKYDQVGLDDKHDALKAVQELLKKSEGKE